MDIPVEHEGFSGRGLTVRLAGLFSGMELLLDGETVAGKRLKYQVRDSNGNEVEIEIKPHFVDPVPRLIIDGETVQLARPLKWYEYLWMGLPILLIFQGGVIGGVCGFVAAYSNAHVFRSGRGAISRYLLSGLISGLAVVVWLAIATLFYLLFSGSPEA